MDSPSKDGTDRPGGASNQSVAWQGWAWRGVAWLGFHLPNKKGISVKFKMSMAVEVDSEVWQGAYGAMDPTALKLDVLRYIDSHVRGSAACDEGALRVLGLRLR